MRKVKPSFVPVLSLPSSLSLSLSPDLRNRSAIFWKGGVSGGYEALLLDEDQGWLLVGGKDHIYLLRPDSLDQPTHTVRCQKNTRRPASDQKKKN